MAIRRIILIGVSLIAALTLLAASLRAQPNAAPEPPEKWTIVRCGHLIAIPGKPPLTNATLFIKNGLIEGVVENYADRALTPYPMNPAATVQRIDLADRWVAPGLIDCHVHITHETSADQRLKAMTDSDADSALDGVVYARRTLQAGFTTVRDLGARGDAVFALRDAILDGKVPGPRILAAGAAISATGGHGDPANGYRRDIWSVLASSAIADNPDEARKAVRTQIKRGADVIKTTATGGVLSNIGAGVEQQLFDDELSAIVQTAHLLGKRVAAHAHGTRGVNAALRAGVDSIEHGTYLDDESISLFKKTGAFYVPTITAGKSVAHYALIPGYYPAPVIPKALAVGPVIQGAFTKAYKAGVKIAFGTDAGVFPHGENAREFLYMVEAGMTPEQALIAATITAAELLNISSDAGTIEKGKSADLIATAADPRADISELTRIRFVMRAGVIGKDDAP